MLSLVEGGGTRGGSRVGVGADGPNEGIPFGWEQIGQIPFDSRAQTTFHLVGVVLLGAMILLSQVLLPTRSIADVYLATPHAGALSLLSILVVVVAHEGTHGVVAAAFGLKPRFGVGFVGILPCAWCTTNGVFHRRAFSACSLAPLLGLDALALGLVLVAPASSGPLAVIGYSVLVANTLGAVADVWGVAYLARFPRGSAVFESRLANLILRPAR